jgi:hypothetical protein
LYLRLAGWVRQLRLLAGQNVKERGDLVDVICAELEDSHGLSQVPGLAGVGII